MIHFTYIASGHVFLLVQLPSLELQLWRKRWSATDPWSAHREVRWSFCSETGNKTRFSNGMKKMTSHSATYISPMFQDWYITHTPVSHFFLLSISVSLFSLPSCVSSLGSILLTLSLRSLIDILGEALQWERARERGMKVTHFSSRRIAF